MMSVQDVLREMRERLDSAGPYDPDVEAWASAIEAAMQQKVAEIERLTKELEVLEERYWESARKHAEKTARMQAEIERVHTALKMAGTALVQDGNLVCDNGWTLNHVVKLALAGKEET
jgi:hypothetical protein